MEKPDCFRKGPKDCNQLQCSSRKDCLCPRIMVVDDEESIRFLYNEELGEEGYIVECAKNGEEALQKLSTFKPDLVSLDIKMPVMDGIEALKLIREKERNLPIILCSAYGEYGQDLTTWASDAFVVKCADLTNYKSTIRKLLSLSENVYEMEISRLKNYISLLIESNESLNKELDQLRKGQNGNTAQPLEHMEKGDLVKYLKLLSQSYQLANHDIMNSVRGIEGAVSICKDMVQQILNNMKEKNQNTFSKRSWKTVYHKLFFTEKKAELAESPYVPNISSTLSECLEIMNKEGEHLTNYLRSFYRLYSEYPSLKEENLLVSSLAAIVSKVREENAKAAINILDTSPQNLNVIFPPWLLYGAISELVKNSIRHVGPACRIIIEWKIENNSLVIGIHDSGKSTKEELQKSYYPFQDFCEIQAITRKKGGGLQLICSILALAGGLVLFTKSPRLGGLLVHLRIPVTCQCGQEG